MAYNLPPPWSSGYAIPDNVDDEGLERRAFITKQMPRGTYDDPRVGNGGFAVPQYIDDEGYGQGTFTTKWQPSGSYSGPKIPPWLNQRPKLVAARPLPGGGRQVTVQPLSGDEPLPPAVETYGAKAAQAILSQISTLPRAQQETALRGIMGRIDKSLYDRTQDIFRRYLAHGVSPADALPLAIARAMAAGVTAELVTKGARRVAPQAGTSLGLGCYMRSPGAMGDTAAPAKPALNCLPPEGYNWVDDGKGGYLVRVRVGVAPNPMPCKADGTPWTVTKSTGAPGGISEPPPPPGTFSIGGMNFQSPTVAAGSGQPLHLDRGGRKPDFAARDLRTLTNEQVKAIGELLLTKPDGPLKDLEHRRPFRPEELAMLARVGIGPETKVNLLTARNMFNPGTAVAYLQDPNNGNNLQLHMIFWPGTDYKDWSPENPQALRVWLSKVPDVSTWGSIINTVIKLPQTLIKIADPLGIGQAISHVVGKTIADGVRKVGDLTCDLVSTPGVGAAAGAVAGAYVGNPAAGAAAGNAGAGAAARACNGAPPPPPPPPVVVKKSVLPLVLVAGGGVLAVALLTKKKKKS
jgi:hypothetical protein